MLRRHFASAGCAVATLVLFCAGLNRDARAEFQQGEFVTHSQDDWGSLNTPASDLLLNHFFDVNPNGVEIGLVGAAGNSAVWSTPERVLDYLPATGPPDALDSDYSDPTSTPAGVFGGYVLALRLDVDFTDAGYITGSAGFPFGDLVLHDLTATPLFNGLTVRQFLGEMNESLGGAAPPYPYEEMAALTDDVTRAFVDGTPTQFAQDHLAIPEPSTVALAMVVMLLDRRLTAKLRCCRVARLTKRCS